MQELSSCIFCGIIYKVMNMDIPQRKEIRLKSVKYNEVGAYFLTVCTYNRKKLLWNNVGKGIARLEDIKLSKYGQTVEYAINNISKIYPAISVDCYSIMPDHIHLLLQIHSENGRAMPAPTISTVIQQMKGYVTKKSGFRVWQPRFQDHIVRGKEDYIEIMIVVSRNAFKRFVKPL